MMEAYSMDVGTRIDPIEFLGFTLHGILWGFGRKRYQLVDDPECVIYVHVATPSTYRVFMKMHENVYINEDTAPQPVCLTYSVNGTLEACERAIRAQRGRAFPWEIEV